MLLRQPLLHLAVFSLFINLLLLIPSIFMLQVFDRVMASGSRETLLVLLAGTGVGLMLMFLLEQVRGRLQGTVGNIVGEVLSPVVTRLTMAQAARRAGPAGPERLRDVATLRSLFSAQGLLAVMDAPWLVIYVALIWLAHPLLGLTAFASAVLMLTLAVVNDRMTRSSIDKLQREAAGASRYLETSLANAEIAQTLGMTDALLDRWRDKNAQVLVLQEETARKTVAMAALTRMLRQGVQVVMLAIGAWLVITGQGSPGITVACTILLGRALAPVEQVVGSWKLLAEARSAFERLAKLLESDGARPPPMELPKPRVQLSATGLMFAASQGERLLLTGVSLQLEPGESLAVIGPSGAGKSTLVRLLTGVWKPSGGMVRLDGADLSQWPREHLGPFLGYVPQDVELFPGTVAENIARLAAVDSQAVVKAASRAGVHDMILSLPQGYDTWVEPQSALISPGQRQRIALARALYREPCMLVLDEPNSNLDGAGEAALAEALKALRGHVTVVVVTHRTTLVQHVDKMLVLEGGRPQHYGLASEVVKAMQARSQASGAKVVAIPRGGAPADRAPASPATSQTAPLAATPA